MGIFGRIKEFFTGSSADPNKHLIREDRKAVENIIVLAERIIVLESKRENASDREKISLMYEEGTLFEALNALLVELENREYTRLSNDINTLDNGLLRVFDALERLDVTQGTPTLPKAVEQLKRSMHLLFSVTEKVAASPEIIAGFDSSMLERTTNLSLGDVHTLVDSIRARQTDQADLERKFAEVTKQIDYMTKNIISVRSMVTLEYDIGVFARTLAGAAAHDDADVATLLSARIDGTRTVLSLCRKLQWDLENIQEAHLIALSDIEAQAADEETRRMVGQSSRQTRTRAAALVGAIRNGSADAARSLVARAQSMKSFVRAPKTIAALMAAFMIAPSAGQIVANARGNPMPPAVTAQGYYEGGETASITSAIPGFRETTQTTKEVETTRTVNVPYQNVVRTTESVKLGYAIKASYKFANVKDIVNGPEVAASFDAAKQDLLKLWQQSGIANYDDFIQQSNISSEIRMFGSADKVGTDQRNQDFWGKGRGQEFASSVVDFFQQMGISDIQYNFVNAGEPANDLFMGRIKGSTVPALERHVNDLQQQIAQLNAAINQSQGTQKGLLKKQRDSLKKEWEKRTGSLLTIRSAIKEHDAAMQRSQRKGANKAVEEIVKACHEDSFLDNEAMLPDRIAEAQVFITLDVPKYTATEEGKVVTIKEKKTVPISVVKIKDPSTITKMANKGTYNPAVMPKPFMMDQRRLQREQTFASQRNTAPTNVAGAVFKSGGGRGGTGGRGSPFIGKR